MISFSEPFSPVTPSHQGHGIIYRQVVCVYDLDEKTSSPVTPSENVYIFIMAKVSIYPTAVKSLYIL